MLNDWIQRGDYFSYHKGKYHYSIFYCDSAKSSTIEKTKPVLVLIHGFPTASIDWQHLWPHLMKHFRLVTLDMIGFGLSDKPLDYAYSISDQADIFQALLKQLAVSEYHLLAHDYGDTVAQELLARQLETTPIEVGKPSGSKILSALLLNGGLFPETHYPVLAQKLLISPLGSWLIKFYSYRKFKKTFAIICARNITEEELNTYWNLLQYNQGRAVMPKLIRYMRERRKYRARWVGALQNSSQPIRVVDGIADPISGGHMLERYRQLISNPDVIELEGIGHYPQVEAPQRVIVAALEFWQRHHFIAVTDFHD
jgi:pimeloyl-ACP methyl ester carboxylesterase